MLLFQLAITGGVLALIISVGVMFLVMSGQTPKYYAKQAIKDGLEFVEIASLRTDMALNGTKYMSGLIPREEETRAYLLTTREIYRVAREQ